MTEQIINKVLRANPAYGVHKLYENGVEFYAPGWIRATIVAYDNENKLVYVQGTMKGCNSKKNVYNESASEIAKEIIDLLNPSKRLATMKYEPEKELFCEKIKVDSQYEGKADKTLEEKLGSDYKKFIEHCENLCNSNLLPDIFNFKNDRKICTPGFWDSGKNGEIKFSEYYTNTKGDEIRFDFVGEPMKEDKYYQRTEYKPKKEVQDGLGNYFHQSDIDNSKVEIYDAKSYFKSWTGFFPKLTDKAEMKYWNGKEMITIKYITSDIQHVITPSKNYFLFKLS